MQKEEPLDQKSSLKEYYDNDAMRKLAAEAFGNEFNHIGIYDDPNNLRPGGLKATQKLLKGIDFQKSYRVLDIGSGYGGTARYIASEYGCHVDCLNISAEENKSNIQQNEARKLDNLIRVFEGDFASLPFEMNQYDIVIAQESITQATDKLKVMQEIARVLKPNGILALADAMWRDNSQEVKEFIASTFWGPEHIASIKDYFDLADKQGMHLIRFKNYSPNLIIGYKDDVQWCEKNLVEAKSDESKKFIHDEKIVFQNRLLASECGYLHLGFFQFKKDTPMLPKPQGWSEQDRLPSLNK